MTAEEYAGSVRAARAEAGAARRLLLADRTEVRRLLAAEPSDWVALTDGPIWRSRGPLPATAEGLAMVFVRKARAQVSGLPAAEYREWARATVARCSPNLLLRELRALRSGTLL